MAKPWPIRSPSSFHSVRIIVTSGLAELNRFGFRHRFTRRISSIGFRDSTNSVFINLSFGVHHCSSWSCHAAECRIFQRPSYGSSPNTASFCGRVATWRLNPFYATCQQVGLSPETMSACCSQLSVANLWTIANSSQSFVWYCPPWRYEWMGMGCSPVKKGKFPHVGGF